MRICSRTKRVSVISLVLGICFQISGCSVNRIGTEVYPGFTSKSIVRLGDDLFVLRDPLRFWIDDEQTDSMTVPSGFIMDLASIPKAFHWWEGPTDRSIAPAIVHDYLYWYQPCDREGADAVMYVGMRAMNMNKAKSYIMHKAVRLGGEDAYKSNKLSRTNGEIRTVNTIFLEQLINSPMNPESTLESILDKAQVEGGLVMEEVADANAASICAIAKEL